MRIDAIKTNASLLVKLLKNLTPPIIYTFLYKFLIVKSIPDADLYEPHYSPWLEKEFKTRYNKIETNTFCTMESAYTLHFFVNQISHLKGTIIEAGVYKGGTARLIAETLTLKDLDIPLYLFDSFAGMEVVDTHEDRHQVGDFQDTTQDEVMKFVLKSGYPEEQLVLVPGWIPQSFDTVKDKMFIFAHVDLDLYQSVLDAVSFIYPRLVSGGIMVFDDYGYASCPGARKAVDEYFSSLDIKPFALPTGQAVIFKR